MEEIKISKEQMEKNVYNNLFEYPTKIIVRLETETEQLEKENENNKLRELLK